MANRIASQAPFILLPRYGEKYEGMARQIKDVIGVARKEARSPEDLAFAEYVASNTVGARMGRAINKRQVAVEGNRPRLLDDQYFGAGSTIDPFFLPYKSGFDRTMSDYLGSGVLPYKGDRVEREFGIDYRDRLASIAHIPKMMERWENLPKVQGNVYRGNNADYAWTEANLTIPRLTSASQSESIARSFAGGGGQKVTISSKTGRRIAAKDAEEEVLFAPNTIFSRAPNPEYQEASRKYSEGARLGMREERILKDGDKLNYYVESGSLPIPKIPGYDELKQMSKTYAPKARWNDMMNEAKTIKKDWQDLNGNYSNEAQQALSAIDSAISKLRQGYNPSYVDEIESLLSNQKKAVYNIYENDLF